MVFETFEPIFKLLPEVKAPEVKPPIKQRILWTLLALVIFFIMGKISVIGIDPSLSAGGQLVQFQQILASNIGTLITVGIGPIVLASIILQLLSGAKIINMDLHDPTQRKKFSSMQKILAIILSFFEAGAFIGFGLLPTSFIVAYPGMAIPVILQIALGSIVLLYLDEVVSKYGIGSGISLFIAAGVAGNFFWQVFQPVITGAGLLNAAAFFNLEGRLFTMINSFLSGQLTSGLEIFIGLFFAILIFMVVVFAEGMHVNIPITMVRTGMGGKFPVKLMYVSNMPVILASALFANIQLWAAIFSTTPFIGELTKGLVWATTVPRIAGNFSLVEGIILALFSNGIALETLGFALLQAVMFVLVLTVLCVFFGIFWVELGNQGPEAVAGQLTQSGMSVPGFRSDPRVIRSILDRYIPPITIIGSIFVGLLAGVADLTLGSLASGTGILLTVGIVYRLYEELAKETVLESNVLLKKLAG
ncbi:MAG: preprotein translocase subunit SecY [Candidatus Diapherotrites archaeon]|nr:preprotein translocase subunit SecY [Candidatus Diapherotrites archaeon]